MAQRIIVPRVSTWTTSATASRGSRMYDPSPATLCRPIRSHVRTLLGIAANLAAVIRRLTNVSIGKRDGEEERAKRRKNGPEGETRDVRRERRIHFLSNTSASEETFRTRNRLVRRRCLRQFEVVRGWGHLRKLPRGKASFSCDRQYRLNET